MKLTDIYPIEKWMAFEKNIHEKSGLDANVFNPDGIRITEYKEWVNRLCPAIKAIDKGQSYICAVAHMNIAAQAMQTRKPAIEECDAGLIKLVVPIFIGDEFAGAVGACGLLAEDGEVDDFPDQQNNRYERRCHSGAFRRHWNHFKAKGGSSGRVYSAGASQNAFAICLRRFNSESIHETDYGGRRRHFRAQCRHRSGAIGPSRCSG